MSDDDATHHLINPDGSKGEGFTLKQLTSTIRCPCGGSFSLSAGAPGGHDASLLHSLPPCMAMIALDPIDFLEWAKSKGARPVQ